MGNNCCSSNQPVPVEYDQKLRLTVTEDHINNLHLDDKQHLPRNTIRKLEGYKAQLTFTTQNALNNLPKFQYDHDKSDEINLPYFDPHEFENGAIYTGQWKNGLRHGRGVQVWQDGSYYEGYWAENQANRQGRLIHADGDVYEGLWLNDKAHGKGIYKHTDGAIYSGDWIEDKQEGHGVETWPDGARYEGDYKQGQKDGNLINSKVMENFNGQMDLALKVNSIRIIFMDMEHIIGLTKDSMLENGEIIKCMVKEFLHGVMEESIQIIKRYDGEYIDDKKQGYGEFVWPDGKQYRGQWQGGKQHGIGYYSSPNGEERQGEWFDGKRIKWLD